jgi:hypothetical protein
MLDEAKTNPKTDVSEGHLNEDDNATVDVRNVLSVLSRRKGLIAAVTIIGLVLTVSAGDKIPQ